MSYLTKPQSVKKYIFCGKFLGFFRFFSWGGALIFFVVCFDFPEGLAAVAVSEVSAANGRTF